MRSIPRDRRARKANRRRFWNRWPGSASMRRCSTLSTRSASTTATMPMPIIFLTRRPTKHSPSSSRRRPHRLGFFAILPMPDVDGDAASDGLRTPGHAARRRAVPVLQPERCPSRRRTAGSPLYAEIGSAPRGGLPFSSQAEPRLRPVTGHEAVRRLHRISLRNHPSSSEPDLQRLTWADIGTSNGSWPTAVVPSPYLSYRLRLMEHDDREQPLFNVRVPEGVTPHSRPLLLRSRRGRRRQCRSPRWPARRIANGYLYGTDIPFIGRGR